MDGNGGANIFETDGTVQSLGIPGNPLSISDTFSSITFGFYEAAGATQFYMAGAARVNAVPIAGSVALLSAGLFGMGMVSRTRTWKKCIVYFVGGCSSYAGATLKLNTRDSDWNSRLLATGAQHRRSQTEVHTLKYTKWECSFLVVPFRNSEEKRCIRR